MMKLYVFPPSPRAFKVRALVRHLNLDVEECLVDLFKGEQRAPSYAALNPNMRMPVLIDGDFVLWESNAILMYLAAKKPAAGLWPSDARGQADVAVVKNHVWTKEKEKYAALEEVGGDKGENVDGSLIVAKSFPPAEAQRVITQERTRVEADATVSAGTFEVQLNLPNDIENELIVQALASDGKEKAHGVTSVKVEKAK